MKTLQTFFLVGLTAWTVWLLRAPLDAAMTSFAHLPNLVFHEAGHIIFSPFGEFMTVLGGSLMQILIPLICAGAFLFQQDDPFGASVCVWWAGESLLDLAPYINDARDLKLMLLGGPADEVEGHDWEAILTSLGWIHLDHAIARGVWWTALAIMIGALAWSALTLLRQRDLESRE
jgi:hypothetical protein